MAEGLQRSPGRIARASVLQSVASAGMELSWLYAVGALVSELLGLPLFPPSLALALFVAAVAGTALSRGRGWRMYTVAGLYAGLLAPVALLATVALRPWVEPGHALADLRFVLAAASTPDAAAWVTPAGLVAGCAAFWWSGLALSRRAAGGAMVSRRFDVGVWVLVAVVVIGWAAGTTGQAVRFLIPSFFLFGVLAVALARGHGTGTRSFPVGFRGAGVAFSAGLALVILGLAAAMLLPVVRQAAQAGYSVVRWAAVSAWPFLLAFLRWLLSLWTRRPDQPVTPPDRREQGPAQRSPLDLGRFEQVLYWAIVGIIAAVLLFLAASLVWQLVRYLGSRSARDDRPASRGFFARLLSRLASGLAALTALLRRLRSWGSPYPATAVEAFARLARWGRRSGVVRRPAETPLEYARRLGAGFPDLRAPITTIVDCLNAELYARRALDGSRRREMHRAARTIRRLRYWLARARGRLRPPESSR